MWVVAAPVVLLSLGAALLSVARRTRIEPVLDELVIWRPFRNAYLADPNKVRLTPVQARKDGRIKVRVETGDDKPFTAVLDPESCPEDAKVLEMTHHAPEAATPYR